MWNDCEKELPKEKQEGIGTYSPMVEVMLSNGEITEDWLINGKWVVHCRNNGGAYPIKWRERRTG